MIKAYITVIGNIDLTPLVNTDKLFRRAALDGLAAITFRVQNKGMGVNGPLVTKARERKGAYELEYGEYRESRGRRTDIMDLTLEGDLFRGFTVFRHNNSWAIGFDNTPGGMGIPSPAEKARKMEAYQGPIFSFTGAEYQENIGIIIKAINEQFGK